MNCLLTCTAELEQRGSHTQIGGIERSNRGWLRAGSRGLGAMVLSAQPACVVHVLAEEAGQEAPATLFKTAQVCRQRGAWVAPGQGVNTCLQSASCGGRFMERLMTLPHRSQRQWCCR